MLTTTDQVTVEREATAVERDAAIGAVRAIAPWVRRDGLRFRVSVYLHAASGEMRALVDCGEHTWRVSNLDRAPQAMPW